MVKLYFASPFFNEEQVEREERLIKKLRALKFEVWSPKENCNLPAQSTYEDRQRIFNDNCDAIRSCDAVFAVTDGKDMGTIWESGFAFGINKPIIYYNETLPENGQFNLMLAQSSNLVLDDYDMFSKEDITILVLIIKAAKGIIRRYRGLIE